MAARPPKIRYTHDAVIDMVIAEPAIHQNEIAARFGYTPSWISTVMTSDAFLAKLESRKAEIIDPVLRMSMEERFKAVTQKSLEVLMEKLCQPACLVSDDLAVKAAALGAKSLGMGQPGSTGMAATGGVEQLADRLIALQRGIQGVEFRRPTIMDVEAL